MTQPNPKRPNVLLITADQLRADSLACFGHPLVKTPNLDALAGDGAIFRRCFSPAPACVPARAAITTGNYPHRCTGVKTMAGRIQDDQPKIAECFNNAGYASYAIGKLHYVPYSPPGQPRVLHGFQHAELAESGRILKKFDPDGQYQGLEDYFDYLRSVGWAGYSRAHAAGNNDPRPYVSPLPQEHHVDGWVAHRTIANIQAHNQHNPDQPFFTWMSFPKPHPPYDPPRPYDSIYDPREVPTPFGDFSMLDDRNSNLRKEALQHDMPSLSPEAIQVMRAHYLGLVSFQDMLIGRVIQTLRELDQLDNTIILYSADHGDMLGDFGTCFKGTFHDGSARVPMILYAPNHIAPGQTCDDLVGLQDILPTLAAAAGIDIGQPVDGYDLNSLLKGQNPPRDHFIGQFSASPTQTYMAHDQTFKYIYSEAGPIEELYDTINDPHELNNLAATQPDACAHYRQLIIDWAKANSDLEILDGDQLKRGHPYSESEFEFRHSRMGYRKY